MAKYSNGDAVLANCIFCGVTYEEAQKLGDKVTCDESQGGCGNSYRVSMYQAPAVNAKDSD